MRYRVGILFIALMAGLTPAHPSSAADYPTKPITLINPNAPGGGHDAVARSFATVAEKMLGQPVIVLNKAGASTMLGMTAVAQAPPMGTPSAWTRRRRRMPSNGRSRTAGNPR